MGARPRRRISEREYKMGSRSGELNAYKIGVRNGYSRMAGLMSGFRV